MELLAIDEAANILGVHPRTVRRYIERGTLEAQRIGGVWRIPLDALRAMFDTPELWEKIAPRIKKRSVDLVEEYLQGKHRLQREGALPVLTVISFKSEKEPWVQESSALWLRALNRTGKDAPFDFVMTADDGGLCQWTLIASMEATRSILEELEKLRKTSDR